jgi:hypothetical protein
VETLVVEASTHVLEDGPGFSMSIKNVDCKNSHVKKVSKTSTVRRLLVE